MLVDSHCHPHLMDLSPFDGSVENVFKIAKAADVTHFLCVSVSLEDAPVLQKIAQQNPSVYYSVGMHPTHTDEPHPTVNTLTALANQDAACIALGETGLDYFHTPPEGQLAQQMAFREHIRAAIAIQKPLIIHTRQAAEDTLRIMEEENAAQIGGVMHCFTESFDVAERAMAMNFYISFSGIVTFKNATELQAVAEKIPADKLLIETDSPYLAPTPFRGKANHPALVTHVASYLSQLRGVSFETLARETSDNFFRCFRIPDVKAQD